MQKGDMPIKDVYQNFKTEFKELRKNIGDKPLGSTLKIGGMLVILATLLTALSAVLGLNIQEKNYTTAQQSLASTQTALNESTKSAEVARSLHVAQIQLELRNRYLTLKPSLDKTQYEKYPSSTKRFLNNAERHTIRKYWTDIVFSEWITIKKFGDGKLDELWDRLYSGWPLNVLIEHRAFREEWCYIQNTSSERIYFGLYAEEFIQEINNLYKNHFKEDIPIALVLRDRELGIPFHERINRNENMTAPDLKDSLIPLKERSIKTSSDVSPIHIILLEDAYKAFTEGNYGVAACLVNKKTGKVILRAHNSVFSPAFRSDSHAEMLVLNLLEDNPTMMKDADKLVLYTSLEPCPMCLARILSSGIKEVRYLAHDDDGGMASKMNSMPKVWRELATKKQIIKEICIPDVAKLAEDIFLRSREGLDASLKK